MHGLTESLMESLLSDLVDDLTVRLSVNNERHSAAAFEQTVRQGLETRLNFYGIEVDLSPHAQQFPDVIIGEYGVEVKFSEKDTWRSIANSISEGTRQTGVKVVYVVFGKIGGVPGARWRRYEDCVIHVRTSHRPRFELDMTAESSLFQLMGISYLDFQSLDIHGRMAYVREYARSRLKPGERLWWMEAESEDEHTLPLQARLYTSLEQSEKRRLRAEAALLCPQIVKPAGSKKKYDDVALYLLTYHGVLASQVRDLFSAGSVAMRSDKRRGGNYLLRALKDLEDEILTAADYLQDELFQEYWGWVPSKSDRLREWLDLADGFAKGWTPSAELFLG